MRESALRLAYTPAEVTIDTMEMLQQATRQAPPTRGGRLWRLLVGEPGADSTPTEAPPARGDDEDLETEVRFLSPDRQIRAPAPGAADAEAISRRIARLEAAIRLLAETLKRVHHDLLGSVADMRSEVALTATSVDVRRALAETLEPLTSSVQTLTEVAQALPLSLGSIAERVAERIDGLQIDLEESLIALVPGSWERAAPPPPPQQGVDVADPDFWGRGG